jgi:hypothetical protein
MLINSNIISCIIYHLSPAKDAFNEPFLDTLLEIYEETGFEKNVCKT